MRKIKERDFYVSPFWDKTGYTYGVYRKGTKCLVKGGFKRPENAWAWVRKNLPMANLIHEGRVVLEKDVDGEITGGHYVGKGERIYQVTFDLQAEDGNRHFASWFVYVIARNQAQAKEKARELWGKDPIRETIIGWEVDRMQYLTAYRSKDPNPQINIFERYPCIVIQ